MKNFNPHRLISYFVVELSRDPKAALQLIADVNDVLKECEPLMIRVESDGSCILQELRHAPVNVDFSSENFPLLFAVARVSAYIIQLERFCRMKQELAFENFMNTSVGQMFLFNLQKLISANQMDFVRFFGEVWQDRIFRGEASIHELSMDFRYFILIHEFHTEITRFFETFLQKVLKVKYGPGCTIMTKKGWHPGQGLGVNGSGRRVPVVLKRYLGRTGLKGEDEHPTKEEEKWTV